MWPAASLAFVETLTGFIAGPYMGGLIDVSNRYELVLYAVVGQNVSQALSCACFYLLVWQGLASPGTVPVDDWRFWAPMIGLYITGAINSICALVDSVSLSKVWIPAICRGDEVALRSTNARLRQVNLFCEIAAPFAFGALLSFLPASTTLSITTLVLFLWNLVSFIPELWVLKAICAAVPELLEPPPPPAGGYKSGVDNPLKQVRRGWSLYVHHNVFLASLGYCFLYLTVLQPGALMTSFLVFYKVEQYQIGVWRGLCALTGIGATVLSPWMQGRMGIVKTGILFSWFQFLVLLPAVGLAFSPSYAPAAAWWALYVFMVLVAVSRVGLWGFDLVEVQIMQTGIESEIRGQVSSVEYAITQLFTMLTYVSGVLVNNPADFVWLVVGSHVSVLLTAGLFSVWSARKSQAYLQRERALIVRLDDGDGEDTMPMTTDADIVENDDFEN